MNILTKLINFMFLTFEKEGFIDDVSGKMVNFYKDVDGTRYMKDGRFAIFKVKAVYQD